MVAAIDAADSVTDAPQQPTAPPRRRRGRRALRIIAALVALLAVYYLVTLVQVWRTGAGDEARHVDAIVVLGAAQYDGRPARVLAARLDHALELYQRGLAPLVVTTGGNQPGDRFTESQASAKYLIEHGVPAEAIVQVQGDTSYDELRAARDVLHGRGLDRVLLVSDPYHMLRIQLVAEELGLTAYVSATRTSPVDGWTAFELHLKEAAGISAGRIIGFDRLLRLTG